MPLYTILVSRCGRLLVRGQEASRCLARLQQASTLFGSVSWARVRSVQETDIDSHGGPMHEAASPSPAHSTFNRETWGEYLRRVRAALLAWCGVEIWPSGPTKHP